MFSARISATSTMMPVKRELTSSIINDRDTKISQRDAQLLNPDSRFYKQVKYQNNFRRRTFKMPDQSSVLFDEVRLKL
jgi:hypothetical protein